MKKIYSTIITLSMCALALTSCKKDDDGSTTTPDPTPTPQPVAVTNGAFVINSGNMSSSINGGVTSYDYTTGATMLDAFKSANAREIGLTANDAVVYGSKMYIIVTGENTVEVVDKNTMKSIKQIKTTELMGEDKGKKPRHGIAYNGQVLVSTYDGFVAAIDTTNYSLKKTYTAGSYPEGLAILDSTLYVANSGNGKKINPSISKINIATGDTTLIVDSLITNPVSFAVVGSTLYYLDSGTYDAAWNQLGAGVRKIEGSKVSKVVDATMMAATGTKIYVCNAPYGSADAPTYGVYDTTAGTLTNFDCTEVFSPAAIAADPVNGNLLVASLQKNPDTGYANYKGNGYVVVYGSDLNKKAQFTTGVGPTAIVFNTGVKYE